MASQTAMNMNDGYNKVLPQGSYGDPRQRGGAALSISTSRTGEESYYGQSTASRGALPPQTPYRTVSSPYPATSPSQINPGTRSNTVGGSDPSRYAEKPSRSGKGDKSPRSPKSPKSPGRPGDTRRHSGDKVNGYTECGRHGDEWLFGGFSFVDTVRKVWDKDRRDSIEEEKEYR